MAPGLQRGSAEPGGEAAGVVQQVLPTDRAAVQGDGGGAVGGRAGEAGWAWQQPGWRAAAATHPGAGAGPQPRPRGQHHPTQTQTPV